MTLQQLEYIVRLDDERHFVRAAERCFVTQPTLTMQVKKLEEEIGIQIFDRSKKPLEPTPMGEQVLIHAREVLREVQQLKDLVNEEKDRLEGTYELGVIPTLAPYLIPLFLKPLTEQYPEIKLVIKEMQSVAIIEALHRGDLDVGLLVTPLDERHLIELPLFYEPFMLYLPMNHPLRGEKTIRATELPGEDVMVLDEGHCFREQALNICGSMSDSVHNYRYQSGSIEALKNLVKRDMGFTLIPEMAVVPGDEPYVRRFESPEPTREVSIVTHKGFSRLAFTQVLQQIIVQEIPDRFHSMKPSKRVRWR
jgi:LysR family hydrogen peroxide-inducible transcriptional activator